MRSWRHIGMLMGMVALLMLALGAAASASTGQDGPTAPNPPELGDPVDGNQVVPHGGYGSTTNFCMQCHDVHKSAGTYALMTTVSVTATCQTCHSVGTGTPPTAGTAVDGGPDPTGTGKADDLANNANALGTVSLRTVYDEGMTDAASGHDIGMQDGNGWITSSAWTKLNYPPAGPSGDTDTPGTASELAGGVYCGTCHTPHGEFGQMVNNWTAADDGTMIWWTDPTDPTGQTHLQRELNLDTATGAWQVCDPGGTANCVWATELDAEGQEVSLFGYKLLSAYPNHSYGTPQSYNTTENNQDSANWCTVCHADRIDVDEGGTFHNHGGGCVGCHGNPSDGTSADFPHTSTADKFMVDYPDALCITCHTKGSLP